MLNVARIGSGELIGIIITISWNYVKTISVHSRTWSKCLRLGILKLFNSGCNNGFIISCLHHFFLDLVKITISKLSSFSWPLMLFRICTWTIAKNICYLIFFINLKTKSTKIGIQRIHACIHKTMVNQGTMYLVLKF